MTSSKRAPGSPFELLADEASWTIGGNSVASRTYREDVLREAIRPFNARRTVGINPTVKSITADSDSGSLKPSEHS